MTKTRFHLCIASAALLCASSALAKNPPQLTVTGAYITPEAAPGSKSEPLAAPLPSFPRHVADHAQTTATSPDGKTLLVLTSGYNGVLNPKGKVEAGEFVFVYDIAGAPVLRQVLTIANSYSGLVFSPDGGAFYASGGQDDSVHTFSLRNGTWVEGAPIALSHGRNGTSDRPLCAGLGITASGATLITANYMSDSISLVDLAHGRKVTDLDLRPGKSDVAFTGIPGGEFPFWVAVKGNAKAYVSSARDREIVVVDLTGKSPKVSERIPVRGNPNKMVLDKAQRRLFVTADNSDLLYVIDTGTDKVLSATNTTAPSGLLGDDDRDHDHDDDDDDDRVRRLPVGSNPNSVTLSPDEQTAYVTNSATNSVAVIGLAARRPWVKGLIPTGWLPNSVSTSRDGKVLYVADGKSAAGPNPGFCTLNQLCLLNNQYIFQDMKASLLTVPVPGDRVLGQLTAQVVENNGFQYRPGQREREVMEFLHRHIQHVIYVIKENRTYDQILGDLKVGNGDPKLVEFGRKITPNFHAISEQFVDLDNFYCSGEVSMDGWQWSTAGRNVDTNAKVVPVNYGKGGATYDSEGTDRNVNVSLPTVAERRALNGGLTADPDYLPGPANEMAIDGIDGIEGAGYLWNGALRAGLSLRNYGVFAQEVNTPLVADPFGTGTKVVVASIAELKDHTDPYFYDYNNRYPDVLRYREWAREFDGYVQNHDLPSLSLVRLPHDHTGAFGSAILGVNTPELQQADNDYAVGLLADKVAHSPYAGSTLIFVLEDDAQAGGDHVDAHRSTGYIVGPYVKHQAVVSTPYSTVNMIRTMEDVLGLPHQNLHTAGVPSMVDAFDIKQRQWTYEATPAAILFNTQLPLDQVKVVHAPPGELPRPLHDGQWWEEHTHDLNFTDCDAVDPELYNRVMWSGVKGDMPYPSLRSGADLRKNRDALLKEAGIQ